MPELIPFKAPLNNVDIEILIDSLID